MSDSGLAERPSQPSDIETGAHPIYAHAPRSVEFNKLRKRLIRNTREAIDKFAMARAGERWLVALSGGKDSYGMLALLLDLQWRGLLPVDLLVCNLDQGQPNFPKHILPEFLGGLGIAHRIEYQDTYSIVTDKLPAARPIVRCARGCGEATFIASRARRSVRPWCWGIIARIASKPSS